MQIKIFFASFVLCSGLLYAQETVQQEEESQQQQEDTVLEENIAGEQNQDKEIPYNLSRNEFFLESLRLKNLANLSLLEGEYDKSAEYSQEAVHYAELSDEYIKKMLVQQKANKAIDEAFRRLAWAKNEDIKKYYPKEFENAQEFYDNAISARKLNEWEDALSNALAVIESLSTVAAPPPKGSVPANLPALPTQYIVRPWDEFGDCFWNIAKWFYGNPWKWRTIYNANKEKIPDPNNPNLIDIGTVLDIPSLKGEVRVGLWDSGRPYAPPL
jgi:nucleoid-associated protein YgaU